jgi:acyl-CoA thioesterase FadM
MKSFSLQYSGQVLSDWIDENGHMNVKSYFGLFESASWAKWKSLSENSELMDSSSMVAGRFYIEHRKELFEGDQLEVWTGIVPFNESAIIMVHRLTSSNNGLIATCEVLTCFFNLRTREKGDFPPEIMRYIKRNAIEGIKPRLALILAGTSGVCSKPDKTKKCHVVIFMVEGNPNHVGLHMPGYGIADLSLIGTRIYPLDDPKFPRGILELFPIVLNNFSDVIDYLKKSSTLSPGIIHQERERRGWHLTEDAPNYILKLRDTRSKEFNNMNCVEWIANAIEIGGQSIPTDILTPGQLRQWCRSNLGEGI